MTETMPKIGENDWKMLKISKNDWKHAYNMQKWLKKKEKKDKYVEFYNRTIEVIVILCQNLIDKLEPSLGSLVAIRGIEEESMPMLYALIDGRD